MFFNAMKLAKTKLTCIFKLLFDYSQELYILSLLVYYDTTYSLLIEMHTKVSSTYKPLSELL